MLHGNKSGEANRDFNNMLFNIIYIMRNQLQGERKLRIKKITELYTSHSYQLNMMKSRINKVCNKQKTKVID